MSAFWMIAASFVLVWIAESAGVAGWFPIGGATGLLISLIILALVGGYSYSYNVKNTIRKTLTFVDEKGRLGYLKPSQFFLDNTALWQQVSVQAELDEDSRFMRLADWSAEMSLKYAAFFKMMGI